MDVRDRDAAELHALIDEMAEAARTSDWIEAASLNARFHQTVVRLADNNILERLWRTLDPLAWLLAPAAIPERQHVPDGLVSRHAALVEALLSGDGDRAASAFRDHIMAGAQMTAGVGERHSVHESNGHEDA